MGSLNVVTRRCKSELLNLLKAGNTVKTATDSYKLLEQEFNLPPEDRDALDNYYKNYKNRLLELKCSQGSVKALYVDLERYFQLFYIIMFELTDRAQIPNYSTSGVNGKVRSLDAFGDSKIVSIKEIVIGNLLHTRVINLKYVKRFNKLNTVRNSITHEHLCVPNLRLKTILEFIYLFYEFTEEFNSTLVKMIDKSSETVSMSVSKSF